MKTLFFALLIISMVLFMTALVVKIAFLALGAMLCVFGSSFLLSQTK